MSIIVKVIRSVWKGEDSRKADKAQLAYSYIIISIFLFLLGVLFLAGFQIRGADRFTQSSFAGIAAIFGIGLCLGSAIRELRAYWKLRKEEPEAKN